MTLVEIGYEDMELQIFFGDSLMWNSNRIIEIYAQKTKKWLTHMGGCNIIIQCDEV